MKKKLLLAFAMGLTVMGARGVPACPAPSTVIQPDGTTLTVRLVGDEFYNYTMTLDGRTVMRTASGAYVYAELNADGTLRESSVLAHDPAARQSDELAYLRMAPAAVRPAQSAAQSTLKSRHRTMVEQGQRGLTDYKKFRGLVILVNYSDKKFSYSNAHEQFTDMITKRDYTGFMNNAQIPTKEVYTGSVRDYFYDQSRGIFDPNFDVVGPVDINLTCTSPRQTSNMGSVLKAVINAADPLVDFKNYDTDGDGQVDMFYIIFAGYGSNYSGNNSYYVWPHASSATYYGIRADGVALGRYACSTELGGWEGRSTYIDGIGVVCHEFSHVLGLMDEYDTDYESGGGQSVDPGDWSVMAGGSYLNKSRTPVGYSLFQRYQSGFVNPKVIKEAGIYELRDIDLTNDGYRINTPEPKEYFLLENRRKTGSKWNCYGPGEGMLVFRVDSTNPSVWSSNKINSNPAHNYYELLRANPAKNVSGTVTDGPGDPFPGSGNVTSLTPSGSPAFKTWGGLTPQFSLDSIWENSGVIGFRIAPDNTKTKIEDFENMSTSGNYDENVTGNFTKWSFSNAYVTKESSGNKALALVKGSSAATAVIPNGWLTNCQFTVINRSGKTAYLRLQAEVNGVMTAVKSRTGTINVSVANNQTETLSFPLDKLVNSRLEVQMVTGSTDNPVYIDDFSVIKDYPLGVGGISLDSGQAPLRAVATAAGIEVSAAPCVPVYLYDLQGRLLLRAATDASGTAVLTPAARGCFIIAAAGNAVKLMY